jgi:hypothetical protein
MRWMTILAGAAALTAAVTTGCAKGPYDAAGYTTLEKDNRIYVFVPNSTEHQQFKKGMDLEKRVTGVGIGPGGRTVIAPDQKILDKYVAAVAKTTP